MAGLRRSSFVGSEDLCEPPDFVKGIVQRRRGDANDVWFAKIAFHAGRFQFLEEFFGCSCANIDNWHPRASVACAVITVKFEPDCQQSLIIEIQRWRLSLRRFASSVLIFEV